MLPLSLKKDEIKDEKMMTIDASCQSPHQIYSRREAWRILLVLSSKTTDRYVRPSSKLS